MKKRILAILLTVCLLFSVIPLASVSASAAGESYSGNLIGGGFESEADMWTITYQKDETVSVDTATTHNSSAGALRVDLAARRSRQVMRTVTTTKEGVAAQFNTSSKRFLELYIKTSADFAGSVYARVKQNGYLKTDDSGAVDFCFIGTLTADGAAVTNWQRFISPAFAVDNNDVEVTLYFNGVGTVWVDDVTVATDKNYLSNGGFENGMWAHWNSIDGVNETAELVTDVTCNSPKAAKLSNTGTGEMYIVTGHREIDPLRNYTLSLDIKSEGVAANGIYVRILQRYIDSNGVESGAWVRYRGSEEIIKTGGTFDWTNFKINIGSWHENLTSFTFYIYLNGKGTAYFDNVSLTTVELDEFSSGEVGVDIEPGEITALDVVHLYTGSANTDIYYTLDGTDPRYSKTAVLHEMKSGVIITEDTLIRACTVNAEGKGEVYDFNYTVSSPLIPDDALLTNKNVSSAVTLDSSTKMQGNNSVKLSGTGSHIVNYTNNIAIDSLYDYKLEFWVKTENLTVADTAYVTLFLPGYSYENHTTTGEYGVYYISKNGIADIKQTQGWTKYEYIISGLVNSYGSMKLAVGITHGYGNMWIDGIKLTAVQAATHPISVLGDGSVYGNNYYGELDTVITQGVNLTNNSEALQSGTVTYNIYNDLNPEVSLGGGSFEISIASGATVNKKLNLPDVDKYGTYTVKFSVNGNYGYTYSAGELHLARLQDNSDINNDTMFGFCTNVSITNYENLAKAGVSMVRTDLDWEDVETSDDNFAIPQNYLTAINTANSYNIDTIVIFNSHSWPSFYTYKNTSSAYPNSGFPRTSAQIEEFLEYVRYVVTALKGKVTYYELFNETNFMGYSICTGAEYANLLKYVYPAIKEIDPDAKLMIGGPSGFSVSYLESILAAGGGSYVDYMCTHPYVYPSSPETAGWPSTIENLNNVMDRYVGRRLPIIFSEVGWSSCVTTRGNSELSKAQNFVRAFAISEAAGNVERITIYREGSGGNELDLESRWGAFNRENSATLAYANPMAVALNNFTALMNDYDYVSSLSLADGLYTYKFEGSTTDMFMLWTNDTEHNAKLTLSDANVRVLDMFGNTADAQLSGKSVTLGISGSPIYIILNKGQSVTAVSYTSSFTGESTVIRDFETADQIFSSVTADTTTSFDGGTSIKIDMSSSSTHNLDIILEGEELSRLDANVRYAVRLHAKADADFAGHIYTNVWNYDGTKQWTQWFNYYYGAFEMIGAVGTNVGISDSWQSYTFAPDQGLVLMGNKMKIQLCIRGEAAGKLWIDAIELVPIDDSSSTHGKVYVSGYDSTLGRTVYTAKAEDGYEVGSIAAKLGEMSSYSPKAFSVEILERVSDSEVRFTVNLDGITPSSSYHLVSRADHRFITASFMPAVDMPMMSPSESFVLNDFETSDQTFGSSTCLDAENPGSGTLSLKCEFTTTNQIIYDIYVNPDEMKNFDANNAYFIRAKYRSTADFSGKIWSNTHMVYGGTQRMIYWAAYKGGVDVIGSTVDSINVTPGTSWTTITSAQSVPVVGEKMRFQLNILRASDTGTLWIDDIELVPAFDNTAVNGYVLSSYDSKNDRLVLTAKGVDGYTPASLKVTPYNYNGYRCTEVPVTVIGMPGIGMTDYTFTFDKVNEADSYAPMFNGSYRFITATFAADDDPVTMLGDCTGDGRVNIKDLIRAKKYMAGQTYDLKLINIDFDSDRYILAFDLKEIRKLILG